MAKPTKAEREIIDAAIKRLDRCVQADSHNRDAAIDDLNFVNGDQWDSAEKKRRADKGRPALQFNLLQKFVDQVVGDMLHNSPSIKVRPVDSRADVGIAKIRQGIISNIEYLSNSKSIYGYAGRQQVSCGYGAWRVLTRYTDNNPFVQEAYIKSVRNPFLVYIDPDASDQFGADAKYGFVLERLCEEDFKAKYPSAKWPSSVLEPGKGLANERWYDKETALVAEYFTVETEKVTMVQMKNGDVVSEDEFERLRSEWREKNARLLAKVVPIAASMPTPTPPPGVAAGSPPPQSAPMAGGMAPPQSALPSMQGPPLSMGAPIPSQVPPQSPPISPAANSLVAGVEMIGEEPAIAKKRDLDCPVVRQRVITAYEILDGGVEGNRFPGKYIPIVLLKGKELNIEGKNYVYSLIRHAKDPQKMLNYWNTAAAETIALAPKTPWVGTAKQFEGYEKDYVAANVENFPFLKYNSDPDAPGPPQRNGPPPPPVAIFEQIRRGEENIKSVIGMFNADLGAPGSEQTGAAITARQRPGDIGTFEFMSNMSGAIAHTGRILNEMIPEIYDSERDVRLRNVDETETFVPINTTLEAAYKAVKERPETYLGIDPARLSQLVAREGKYARFNDITVGKYDVVVTTGPSYATQRQESAQHLIQLMQAAPQQMAIALDLIVRNLDFKDSDELETRLRKNLLASGIVKPRAGETPPPPPPPNPEVVHAQAMMQKAQAQTMIAQMQVEKERLQLEEHKLRLQISLAQLEAETGTKDASALLKAIESDRKFTVESDRVRMEQERLNHQREMDEHDMALRASEQFHKRMSSGGKEK